MNQEEELVSKAALALSNAFFVELINRAKAANRVGFVGKVKRVCEILELENQVAASVRYAAILARDFPETFQQKTKKVEAKMDGKQIALRLRENQIHSGMVVCLYLEGKEDPERDEQGNPLILQALLGAGHPFNPYLYPVEGGIEQAGDVILTNPMIGFDPNVRFQPLHVYTPEDAPCGEKYVVFVNGECLFYEGMEQRLTNRVYLFRDEQGRFQNKGCCPKDGVTAYHRFVFPLPEGALLVSLNEGEKLRTQA